MPLIESESEEVKSLQGLHLYHFVMSNCSQRVRLALAEKGLAWTSHHVDIPAGEQLSASYRRIHPAGLVPTLIDDGQVIIESNDIIDYLDQHFPGPALAATDFLQRQLDFAMAENGVIASLSELHKITTIAQLEQLARHLFPAGGTVGEFNSSNWDEELPPEHDHLQIYTGLSDSGLANYFAGYGYVECLDYETGTVWYAPFDSATPDWWKPFEETWVEAIYSEPTRTVDEQGRITVHRNIQNQEEYTAWQQGSWGQDRHQAWREQGIVCWANNA